MKSWTQGFQAEHCSEHHTGLQLVQCILLASLPSSSMTYKKKIIHQTRSPSSVASWSSTFAHMQNVGAFAGEHGAKMTLLDWTRRVRMRSLQSSVSLGHWLSFLWATYCTKCGHPTRPAVLEMSQTSQFVPCQRRSPILPSRAAYLLNN